MFDVPRKNHGVALIVTLILLSVITFLAIAFLTLSQRERGSVTTTTHMTEARFAADTARERATAEIIANMFAYNNEFAFGMRVSTNYVNGAGFDTTQTTGEIWPTNVNYEYLQSGAPLTTYGQMEQNIANLFYNARPPVFIFSNKNQITPPEFRFYLDLNRNGRYDTNGLLPVVAQNGEFYRTDGTTFPPPPFGTPLPTNTLFNFFVGDPEWIGGLDRPDFPHSSSNRFTHRYAYLVVPVGKTLDANFLHNQAYTKSVATPGNDGFLRNQGVGTWEINLAAFFADLNTNQWNPGGIDYKYQKLANVNNINTGLAFDDAFSILKHRYAGNYNNLRSANTLFGMVNAGNFTADGIDEYSDDTTLFTTSPLFENVPADATGQPWVGDDNPNHFFTTQDLFDPNKTSTFFSNRLYAAGTNLSSYDRYTFSRLVEQLGTDSSPEGRMNLNWKNVDASGKVVMGMETNFIAWQPIEFFTNAASRLLLNAGFKFSVTNIPIYDGTNASIGYTPSVHRLLQLAANLYDSTTNYRSDTLTYPYFPSVFRPVFERRDEATPGGGTVTKVFITSFREVTSGTTLWGSRQVDLDDVLQGTVTLTKNDLIKGVPAIVGAKKGFPNFNELVSDTIVQVGRNLRFYKERDGVFGATRAEQQFLFNMTNYFGVEFWNSYYQLDYPRALTLIVSNELTLTVKNSSGTTLTSPGNPANPVVYYFYSNLPPNTFRAVVKPGVTFPNTASFVLPFTSSGNKTSLVTTVGLAASTYASRNVFQPGLAPPTDLGITMKMHFRAILIDDATSRVVDYVDMTGQPFTTNLFRALAANPQTAAFWGTNRQPNVQYYGDTAPPDGVVEQVQTSLGQKNQSNNTLWKDYNKQTGDKESGIRGFQAFWNSQSKTNPAQAPYSPAGNFSMRVRWEANDPLVHYIPGDLGKTNKLIYLTSDQLKNRTFSGTSSAGLPGGLGSINQRYLPWGGRPGALTGESDDSVSSDASLNNNHALKDSLVTSSDLWDFPTNKYPSVGWMGRVHRGTPWQTVYLKSTAIDIGTWTNKWTGNVAVQTNWYGGGTNIDGEFTLPIQDWKIFDLFTAAPNDNAGRGQLSVNQHNLAAWSAVLSGVVVLTNDSSLSPVQLLAQVIEPAGIYDPFVPATFPKLLRIVNGINRTRNNTDSKAGPVFGNQAFSHVGDVLATPELTVNSPYLNTANLASLSAGGLNDAAIERIPQQILGLLRAGEQRFVIYAYGQSLRPADNSVLTIGRFRGMCTNYQIVAESAARAVLRVDGVKDGRPTVTMESYNLLPPD